MELPEYFPVSSTDSRNQLEKLRSHLLPQDELKKTEEDILSAANQFIEQLLTSDDADPNELNPLNQLIAAYETLKKTQNSDATFNKAFTNAKNETKKASHIEPELTVRTIDEYRRKSAEDTFAKRLENNLKDPSFIRNDTSYKTSADYVFLKNASFVLNNPDKPLPNEDEGDDDDLEIEGGTVDLRCPLTMKTFETPYISKKCGHTFDLEGIKSTWKDGFAKACPIPGCVQVLRSSDFQLDRLMALRVGSYNKQSRTHKDATNYDVV